MPEQTLVAITELPDEELVRISASKTYGSPEWDELARRCRKKLLQVFRYFVLKQQFYPPGVDPVEFIEDCVSQLQLKLLKTLRTAQIENVSDYLWTAGKRTIIDAYRDRGGGKGPGIGKEKLPEEAEEKEQPVGESAELPEKADRKLKPTIDIDEIDIVDTTEIPTGASLWNLSYHERRIRKDPSLAVQGREMHEIIDSLLEIHGIAGSKRDKECCLWIREHLNGTGVPDIATRRGTTADDVYHLFREDYQSLYEICQQRYPGLRRKDVEL